MRSILYLMLLVGMAAGCQSAPEERSPAYDVLLANELIDGQRIIKRQLLLADPIERRIEGHLQRDPRVEAARFAIIIFDFGWSFVRTVSESAPLSFATVITARQCMTDDEARQLLEAACHASGYSLNRHSAALVRDGNTWAVHLGLIQPDAQENPDLSVLRAD